MSSALALAAATGIALALALGLALRRAGRRRLAALAAQRDLAIAEQEALRARVEILSRHANDMMLLTDERQRLVDVNDRVCELTGFTREELIGRPVRELRDPDTLADFDGRTTEQIEKGGLIFETRYRRKDGTTFPVEVSVRTAIFGGTRFFQAIIRDITDRRRLELQLQLADRMASVSTLAAGVAHEINNPLAYLVANLDYALAELGRPGLDEAELRGALSEARDGAQRIRRIVGDLRAFARGQDSASEPLDVRRVLQTTMALAQNEIQQRARLAMELGEVPPVQGNEHRLGQALLNLLVNAAKAIPPGQPDRHLVQASTSLAEDGRVAVEIIDTGAGIPPSALPRIFDPFYTTRPVGAGTGLGLAIVHGIVSDMGGEIRVRSEPGQGSIFTVLLPPAAPSPAARPPPPAPAPTPASTPTPAQAPSVAPGPAPGPGGRVLLIDDEPLVGRAVSRILSPPHQVTVMRSAVTGLAELEAGGWDAVLCDLMMPEMTGMDLHARLAEARPADAARIIFLTGGAYSDGAREFLERVGNVRLEKPFDPQALRAAVAGAVRASRGGGAG